MKNSMILPVAAVLAMVAALFVPSSEAQNTMRYLVSDANGPARVTHCVLVRPTTPVSTSYESPAEAVGGMKRCRIDLLALNIPMVGTVTVAYKDSVAQEVGPFATFPFPDPIPAATGFRLSSN